MFKEWTYKLLIENTLDRDLVLIDKTCPYGDIQCADKLICANGGRGKFEITTPGGAPYGLQFSVTYGDKIPKNMPAYGTFTINIDIPFILNNNSSCNTTGIIKVNGFERLPARGHDFQNSIVVTSKL